MRIVPNHHRLRMVAFFCWALGAWWLLQPRLLAAAGLPLILGAGGVIVAALLIAVGAAFWLLAGDRGAGVTFERKGLSLQLGHSSAFVSWENIAAVGVTSRRSSLLALGSRGQVGIRLHNPEQYLQSYEARVPASPGLLARCVRQVERLTRGDRTAAEPSLESIAGLRRRTGYDIIIPEAQLGVRAVSFAALLDSYRASPEQRRALPTGLVIGRTV